MKIKTVYQHDECDCGAACVSMILDYYGYSTSLQKIREMVGTSSSGTSLYGMIEGCKKVGVECEALKGTRNELLDGIKQSEVKLPFIAHMSDNHYIVVSNLTKKNIIIIDPEFGKMKITQDDFFQKWSGYILTLFPGSNFVKKSEKTDFFKLMRMVLRGHWKSIAVIFIMSAVVFSFGILSSFIFQTISENNGYVETEHEGHNHTHEEESSENVVLEDETDDEEDNIVSVFINFIYKESGSLSLFFLVLILMYLITFVISYIRGKIVINFSKQIDKGTTLRYLKSVLALPLQSKNLRTNGDYISRFSDSYRVRYAISDISVSLISDVFLSIIGAILLCEINATLFLISLLMICFYCVIVWAFKEKINIFNRRCMQKNAKMQSYFKECLDGFEQIKENASEGEALSVIEQKYNSMIDMFCKNDLLSIKESTLLNFVEMIGNLLILWVGFAFVDNGYFSIGSLITFTMLLSYFTSPIKNVLLLQPSIQGASNALERIYDIIDSESEDIFSGDNLLDSTCVYFDKVSFGYSEYNVLENFSMRVSNGKVTGISGNSGVGKSTLMKLLLRLYECNEGNIFIGNQNIKEIKLNELRKKILYVGQNDFMFENTFLYNITWNEKREVDEEIENIVSVCCLQDFVSGQPAGYYSLIKENGLSLSKGQRQKMMIAHALLCKPEILILDEAFSNIDSECAMQMLKNIKEIMEGKTLILISHSEEILSKCDQVIKM